MATLKSVASEQGVETPDVQQSFRLLGELARQLRAEELCPDCGQPDNCGDCDHAPLTEEQLRLLLPTEGGEAL